jgi:hypothetical protein
MRGGKSGRKRKSDVWNEAKPGKKVLKTKLVGSRRPSDLPPKKGSRKNTEFGGSSTREED